jgi:cohesin loading factor subunit SCC2
VDKKPSVKEMHSPGVKPQSHKQKFSKIEIALPSPRPIETSAVPTTPVQHVQAPIKVESQPDEPVSAPLFIAPQLLHTPSIAPSLTVKLPVTPSPPPQPTPSAHSRASEQPLLTVELTPSTAINRDEYVDMDIPDSPDEPLRLSSRKRKREGFDGLSTSLDQRQRAEAALKDLRRLTRDIFGAVENILALQPGYSHIATLNADQEPTLTTETHQKVHAAIKDVIEKGCYSQVPIEDLLRLQKLSEGGLRQVENLDIRIDEAWAESEVQACLRQLPDVETALKAARTSLRIMSGGRENKQLYSEETIQQCLNVFKTVIEGIIIPVSELRPSGSSNSLFRLLSAHKKVVGTIFTNTQRLFSLLATLVTSIELSESVLNTLEFSASRLIFVENAHSDKESVVGGQKFDGIRMVAMEMLSQIFLANESQRQGIIDDILISLEKLPTGKQSARTFKLSEGGSIQPVSALIMRLVHSSSSRIDNNRAQSRGAMIGSLQDAGENDDQEESLRDIATSRFGYQ